MISRWEEPEAVMSILWEVLYGSMKLMGIVCTKLDLHGPKNMCLTLRHTEGLIMSIEKELCQGEMALVGIFGKSSCYSCTWN